MAEHSGEPEFLLYVHIPPLKFSFRSTLKKTPAVAFTRSTAMGIIMGIMVSGELERGLVLLKQHLISRRNC